MLHYTSKVTYSPCKMAQISKWLQKKKGGLFHGLFALGISNVLDTWDYCLINQIMKDANAVSPFLNAFDTILILS